MLTKIKTIFLSVMFLQACVNTDYILDPEVEGTRGTVQIQSTTQSLKINDSAQLDAQLYDTKNNPVQNVSVIWSSSNTSIISVTETGFIEAKQPGQVWIFASAEGFEMDSIILSVVKSTDQLASITISAKNNIIGVGQSIQLQAIGKTVDEIEVSYATFDWISSDPSVVSVNASGLATAQKSGSAQIFATSEGIQSNTITINVNGQKKTGMFQPGAGSSYNVSGTAELISEGNSLVLNFESDFVTSNGPDLRIYLSPTSRVASGSIELGNLKSTIGAQSYDVLSGHSLSDFNYVIVHCVPFNVSFGQAFIQ